MIEWIKGKVQQLLKWLRGKRSSSAPSISTNQEAVRKVGTGAIALPHKDLIWVETNLRKLNQKLIGSDYPEQMPDFLQRLPRSLLNDVITMDVVVEAVRELVRQTSKRIGKWDIPFRKPRVEFTPFLLNGEPGHIEFDDDETVIRIKASYIDDNLSLAAILSHELGHFIIDHNDISQADRLEQERITDLFVFRSGLGLIRLQGILNEKFTEQYKIEEKLGYLSLEMMAYAHVRCAAQHGVAITEIERALTGRVQQAVRSMIDFLMIRSDNGFKGKLSEIILCPNQHILRIPPKRNGLRMRCPKCGWQDEIWLDRQALLSSLIERGKQEFDSGRMDQALKYFRDAQGVDTLHAMSYCWAARCLERKGEYQSAVREIRKILIKKPEDAIAQNEMKRLLNR